MVEPSTIPIRALGRPALIALFAVLAFSTLLAVWTAFAPLAGGAVAQGRISPEGARRTVQHLEGGIIEEILARDGDQVLEGDVLIRLQSTQARAGFQVLEDQRLRLEAQLERLQNEQRGSEVPEFSEDLNAEAVRDPSFARILQGQVDQFEARSALHANRSEVLNRRIAQLNEEIAGLEEQMLRQDDRAELIAEEVSSLETLVRNGLAPRPRLLALQREAVMIAESKAANRASVARAQQAIGEAEGQLLALEAERLDEIAESIASVEAMRAEVLERVIPSEDILERTLIRAPSSGTVVGLAFSNSGAVIQAGQPILDIVPDGERLIVDARLSPLDRDSVWPGMQATVNITALPLRRAPRLFGEVLDISADAIVDEATGLEYFRARVSVDLSQLEAEAPDLQVTPGMPAEVLFVTGERTLLEYLVDPLRQSFSRALREE